MILNHISLYLNNPNFRNGSNMKKAITFEDVLLIPQFSTISSRKDVDLSVNMFGIKFNLPILSAPMDTVTGSEMCKSLFESGGIGILHRFMSIENNVKEFKQSNNLAICSLGLNDFERFESLMDQGCFIFNIDVANGATEDCVKFYNKLREYEENIYIIVGNFATADSILEFNKRVNIKPDAYRINIGGGSVCKTRIVSGCGVPVLTTLLDCKAKGIDNIICDGGLENSGDIVKALAAGAKMVITGSLLAGTDEAASEYYHFTGSYYKQTNKNGKILLPKIESELMMINLDLNPFSKTSNNTGFYYLGSQAKGKMGLLPPTHKQYRGSASKESYEDQGKTASHRAPEGECTYVSLKGPVKTVIQELEAGIRSGMTYCNARTLEELKEKAEFIEITHAAHVESTPYGKKQ